jgi:hypothetical protein
MSIFNKINYNGASNFTIPSTFNSIGYQAFYNDNRIYNITIPRSITKIGAEAFYNCVNLTTVTFEIGSMLNKIESSAFSNCSKLVNINLPLSLEYIGNNVFSYCTLLKNILFQSDSILKSIGDNAFLFCNLTEILIPQSVTSIGINAFGNTKLISITFEGKQPIIYNPKNLANFLFYGITTACNVYIYDLQIPYWTNLIKNTDNTYTYSTKPVTIMPYFKTEGTQNITITGIYKSIYTDIIIPNVINDKSVTSIGYNAFFGSSLVSITIPDSVNTIEDFAFRSCQVLISISIPGSVSYIGDSAFFECSSLPSIDIPNSVTSISDSIFILCISLISINLPNSIKSIGSYAFGSCSALRSINFPNSLQSIGMYAFNNCSSLTSITIPNSVISINNHAFFFCNELQNISFETDSQLSNIGTNIFFGCAKLSSISLPIGMKMISNAMFKGSLIKTINISNSITSINNSAFESVKTLTEINFPETSNLYKIASRAFYNTGLTTITIPYNVMSIGTDAFINSNLGNIYFQGNPPNIRGNPFPLNCIIYYNYPIITDIITTDGINTKYYDNVNHWEIYGNNFYGITLNKKDNNISQFVNTSNINNISDTINTSNYSIINYIILFLIIIVTIILIRLL